jgi:hypothetical protein
LGGASLLGHNLNTRVSVRRGRIRVSAWRMKSIIVLINSTPILKYPRPIPRRHLPQVWLKHRDSKDWSNQCRHRANFENLTINIDSHHFWWIMGRKPSRYTMILTSSVVHKSLFLEEVITNSKVLQWVPVNIAIIIVQKSKSKKVQI